MKEKKSLRDPTESGGEVEATVEDFKKKNFKYLLLCTLISKKSSDKTEIPEEQRDEWLDCKWNW